MEDEELKDQKPKSALAEFSNKVILKSESLNGVHTLPENQFEVSSEASIRVTDRKMALNKATEIVFSNFPKDSFMASIGAMKSTITNESATSKNKPEASCEALEIDLDKNRSESENPSEVKKVNVSEFLTSSYSTEVDINEKASRASSAASSHPKRSCASKSRRALKP